MYRGIDVAFCLLADSNRGEFAKETREQTSGILAIFKDNDGNQLVLSSR